MAPLTTSECSEAFTSGLRPRDLFINGAEKTGGRLGLLAAFISQAPIGRVYEGGLI